MKRITKISIIAAGALVVVSSIIAFNHFGSTEKWAQWMVERTTDKLELTELQQEKLMALKDEIMASRTDMKQQFVQSRGQFISLFDASTLDQQQALSLVSTHTQFVDKRAPLIVATFADFYDSLDLEQQAEVREFIQEHHEAHDHYSRWGSHGAVGLN